MKTAMQELIDQLDPIHEGVKLLATRLLEMEKQQIIDAINDVSRNNVMYANKIVSSLSPIEGELFMHNEKLAEQYYNETYGGDSTTSLELLFLATQAQELDMGYESSIRKMTEEEWQAAERAQTSDGRTKLHWKTSLLIHTPEISDEEITKLANEHILYNDSKRQWVIEGMKLYREQLKINNK